MDIQAKFEKLERAFENKWLAEFKKNITLPLYGWFSVEDGCLKIIYFYKGEKQSINLSEKEVPEFLVHHRIIDKVVYTSNSHRMIGFDGNELHWSDIIFSRQDIAHLASINEYEKTGMKSNPAKIIWFYTMYQAA